MPAPSLRVKITLALLFVGLASAVLVGIVAREILMLRFNEIQMNQSFSRFHDDVVDYYRTFGTWENGVRTQAFGEFSRQRNAAIGSGRGRGGRGGPPPPPPDDGPPGFEAPGQAPAGEPPSAP